MMYDGLSLLQLNVSEQINDYCVFAWYYSWQLHLSYMNQYVSISYTLTHANMNCGSEWYILETENKAESIEACVFTERNIEVATMERIFIATKAQTSSARLSWKRGIFRWSWRLFVFDRFMRWGHEASSSCDTCESWKYVLQLPDYGAHQPSGGAGSACTLSMH